MTEDEKIKAHGELKRTITKALWEFSDKHVDDIVDAINIIQKVLWESSCETEYQIAKQSPFTPFQLDHICYQIGDWYLMMKPLLEGQHNLGYMKEKLKIMICGDKDE